MADPCLMDYFIKYCKDAVQKAPPTLGVITTVFSLTALIRMECGTFGAMTHKVGVGRTAQA